MIELVLAVDSPIEWVEASETCLQYGDEGIPTLDQAREFATTGQRVTAQEWHYYGDIIDCVFSGRVLVDEEVWTFRAHPTGAGMLWRDEDSAVEYILCTECLGWTRPALGGEY